ncbi:MAG: hypothetical protein PHI68_06710, partial [Candidatus Cloacimonetes bacterium]|nr:hypothetical protein [Candidatus Cloacimonadota bacterium]
MPVRYTEHQKLSQIRTKRFMRCLVPMLLLFATVIFTILAPGHSYYLYPSLILIVMSISWFLYVSNTFRCKKGIVIPENNGLLSPIEGRIKTIRKTDVYILLTISKAAFDLVELRAPAHNSRVLYN